VVLASATQEAAAPQKTKARIPLKQAGDEADALPASSNSGSTPQMLLSIGSSLLIVIGLFLGLAWFYRKTLNTSLSGGLPKQVVQVLGRTPIATRQQLVLVRFGSKLVLVSLVQGEARTISEITDPLEVDQLAGLCESSQPGSISSSFRSILHQGGAV
jgi:flagellar biogenesis protein FliO